MFFTLVKNFKIFLNRKTILIEYNINLKVYSLFFVSLPLKHYYTEY